MNDAKYAISSVARVFEILRFVAEGDPHNGLSLADISKKNALDKSTIHRYLQTLEQLGMVERTERDTYRLGWGVLELAGKYLDHVSLLNVADTYMEQLSRISGETIHLAVPAGFEVIYVGKFTGPHSIQMSAQIGSRMPMYCTALGKAILAYLPADRQAAVLDQGMPTRTANTITERAAMQSELEKVRTQLYSVDDIENEDGVRCVGAPIFDYRGSVVGAISVSGPSNRVTQERVAEIGSQVRATAKDISHRLGYVGG